MPDGDAAVAPLGHQVLVLLLITLLWVALAAAAIGLARALLVRRPAGVAPPRPDEPPARRFLRIAFGLLWIVDGLLQAQPSMPGGFIRDIVDPALAGGPTWLTDLVAPVARGWTRHPVAADVATVWVQVGLGLLLLIARSGRLLRIAVAATVGWSLLVWVAGEGFGGLLHSGAGWLTGAPGAVLIYAAAALLLLLHDDRWTSGQVALLVRWGTAGWLALAALLQAWPGEQMWNGSGLADPFTTGAANAQPEVFAAPIARLATLAADHPVAVNSVVIALLAVAAAALWRSGSVAVVAGALLLCALTWWLAQDFGVLGGMGTDPNAALPLALLLAIALPAWARGPSPADREPAPATDARPRLRAGGRAAVVALCLGLTVAAPAALAASLPGPPDSAALAADSLGGVRRLPDRAAVPFDLVDQRGTRVSLSTLHGRLVVLTFLDPVCTSDCPLIANQLALADRRLGALASQVEFVAIDTNPVFRFPADTAAFTDSHGLAPLANWHFLTGSPDAVDAVLAAYGVSVGVPTVGMIEHSEGLYFITPSGRQAAYLDDRAGEQLTRTYADRVKAEIRTRLR